MLAPIVAGAATTPGPHPYGLFVNGVDLIPPALRTGNQVGVPIESVHVTEAGPGGVSGLEFTLEIPVAGSFSIGETDVVELWDLANNLPLFAGWLMTPTSTPAFGGQGASIACRCIGVEAILDWSYGAAFTFGPPGAAPSKAGFLQALVANAFYPPLAWLRCFASSVFGNEVSSQATPTGSVFVFGSVLASDIGTIPAGTLRSQIQTFIDRCVATALPETVVPYTSKFTVDMYRGLRSWFEDGGVVGGRPSDYGSLTVVDTTVGAKVADGLRHTADAAAVVRGVYVTDSLGVVQGLVMDGTGRAGRITAITVPSSTWAAAFVAKAYARNEFAANGVAARGSFDLDEPAGLAIHPGTPLSLTDAATGVTGNYIVSELERRFVPGGRQTVTVSYGGRPASIVDQVVTV